MVELCLQPARLQSPVAQPPFHTWTFPDGTLWTEFHRANGGYLLRFPDLADFQVSADALHVTGFPAPEVADATVQHLYLNQVLPLVLSKLGKLVFHASAVEIGAGAVAFVADKMLTRDARLKIPEQVVTRQVGDETVLLNLEFCKFSRDRQGRPHRASRRRHSQGLNHGLPRMALITRIFSV